MWTPFALNSDPVANPRRYTRVLSQEAAAVIPAGNTLTRSLRLTPDGPSERQSPEKLSLGISAIFLI